MKKYFTIFLLALLLASCNKIEDTEVVTNSGEIQKQETIKPEVSQLPETNT
jgi:PBP1b-binding outer membrane lipoprotein LpoB